MHAMLRFASSSHSASTLALLVCSGFPHKVCAGVWGGVLRVAPRRIGTGCGVLLAGVSTDVKEKRTTLQGMGTGLCGSFDRDCLRLFSGTIACAGVRASKGCTLLQELTRCIHELTATLQESAICFYNKNPVIHFGVCSETFLKFFFTR